VIVLTLLESDIDDDTRTAAVQKEHERLLVLQERTNDRLRELEVANAEKQGLLRAALLDRQNLPPELLELKRVETIREMRERIESVIKAPAEVQPQVLDTTSSEIAETVLSSEAALDKAKKVSNKQISHSKSPSSAFDAAVSAMKKHQLEPSFTAATLVSPASPNRTHLGKDKSLSDMSTSTAGTGQTTWGRMAQLVSPKRRTKSTMGGTEYYTMQSSNDCAASLSLAWLPEYTYPTDYLSLFIPSTHLLAPMLTRNRRTSRINSQLTAHFASNSSSQRRRRQRRARYVAFPPSPEQRRGNLGYGSNKCSNKQVELQQEVENLRRENALVKSMWYDMNQRLLSNTVILQRRSEAPKGWLGKQRAAVGGSSVLVR